MDLLPGRPLTVSETVERLQEARARTLLLTAPLTEEELTVQHDPLMSPIAWDLGHIAHFEEVWLLERLAAVPGSGEGLRGVYDPARHPRASRADLDLPPPAELREYLAGIRRRILERLRSFGAGPDTPVSPDDPLLHQGFVFRMVLQHEYQHNETILQTLQLMRGRPYPAPRAVLPPVPCGARAPGREMARFPGGRVEIGSDDRSQTYDNERPRHVVEVEPFWIDVAPVTNGEYLAFMEDGGYRDRDFWDPAGWAWLERAGVEAPRYWRREDGRWRVRTMDQWREPPADHPVCHICWYEADAWARWAGKRLPTEVEWEVAAGWDADAGCARPFPWGDEPASAARANIDQLTFGTAPVGAYPDNVSPLGCYGMIGDVWEWTSSDFHGYPDFEAFPYREYSEVFFGDEYKVLRGGSWATRPGAVRNTFRNWDYPVRRQIFSGFRCARDDG